MKKRGFTLVELLAVIIILAVIALIATPLVLNVVDSAKKSAWESSAYGIIEAVKMNSMDEMLEGKSMEAVYEFPSNNIDIQGSQPTGGQASVDSKGRVAIAIHNGKWCALKDYDDAEVTLVDYDGECTLGMEIAGDEPIDETPIIQEEPEVECIGGDCGYDEIVVVPEEEPEGGSGTVAGGSNGKKNIYFTIYTVGYLTNTTITDKTYTINITGLPIDLSKYDLELVSSGVMTTQADFNNYVAMKQNGKPATSLVGSTTNSGSAVVTAEEMYQYSLGTNELILNSVIISCGLTSCQATMDERFQNLSGKTFHQTKTVGGADLNALYNGVKFKVKAVEKTEYADNSGANRPKLLDNMIPVKYENGSWIYADIKKEWYDYNSKEWANGVVLNKGISKSVGDEITENDISLWYVWIPRYKYTIFNGNNEAVDEQIIDIKFETGTSSTGTVNCVDAINTKNAEGSIIAISETCTDTTNGSIINGKSTYTHPSFTFGDTELTGFWVGKFEVSGTTDAITIKPNVDSLRNTNISTLFTAIQNIDTVYSTNGNSHMMKNMEWGAVAYLKQSKYGLGLTDIGINNYGISNGNNSYTLKTGCGSEAESEESTICNAYDTETGMLASTTGNIYGVYDMSGGAYEYTMANMVDKNGQFTSKNSGFTEVPDSKYYDVYTYKYINTNTHARGKLGDATKETIKTFDDVNGDDGWTCDTAGLPNDFLSAPWVIRGGIYTFNSNAGVFFYISTDGDTSDTLSSSRAVAFK